MIINKSTFNFPDCIFILNQEGIRRWYGDKAYFIEKYYSKDIDWLRYAHLDAVHGDLMEWQCMFPYDTCAIRYTHFAQYNFKTRTWDITQYPFWRDSGYSQVEYSLSGGVDKQAFMSEEWINLFLANANGGIAIRINRINYDVLFYAIGEDDGAWFLTGSLRIKNINYWKNLIMSEISELHIPGFSHQVVIEKIWNGDLTNIENV